MKESETAEGEKVDNVYRPGSCIPRTFETKETCPFVAKTWKDIESCDLPAGHSSRHCCDRGNNWEWHLQCDTCGGLIGATDYGSTCLCAEAERDFPEPAGEAAPSEGDKCIDHVRRILLDADTLEEFLTNKENHGFKKTMYYLQEFARAHETLKPRDWKVGKEKGE